MNYNQAIQLLSKLNITDKDKQQLYTKIVKRKRIIDFHNKSKL